MWLKTLADAQKELNIQGVFLRDSKIQCHEDVYISHGSIGKTGLKVEHKFGIIRVISFDEVDKDSNRVHGGVKIIGFAEVVLLSLEDNEDNEEYFRISTKLSAEYITKKEIKEEDMPIIEKFASENAILHMWPYWREYVQNTCSRVGIAPISIPTQKPKIILEKQ